MAILVGIYVVTLLVSEAVATVVGPTVVGAIAFAGLGYQVANVADNGVKGAHYRPELDRKEE